MEVFALGQLVSVLFHLHFLRKLIFLQQVPNVWHFFLLQVLDGLVPIGLLALEGLDHAALEGCQVWRLIEIVLGH